MRLEQGSLGAAGAELVAGAGVELGAVCATARAAEMMVISASTATIEAGKRYARMRSGPWYAMWFNGNSLVRRRSLASSTRPSMELAKDNLSQFTVGTQKSCAVHKLT
jgi:hypothetical protein